MSLPPVSKPVVKYGNLVAAHGETLVIKEKLMSFSGDSFDVKNGQKQTILKVKGKTMTISGRKSIYDAANTHLFDIVKEHLHIHTTYAAEDPSGKKFLEIKSSLKLMGSKATGTFTADNGEQHVLEMKGNWFDTSADIVNKTTDEVVAQIDRKLFNFREMFGDQQTYAVKVAPGVDVSLIAALCIALDEKNNEPGK